MSGARRKTTAREHRRAAERAGKVFPVEETPRDWRTESVFVATPHRPDVQANFTYSLLRMFAHDSHGVIARGGGPLLTNATPMNLPDVRNTIIKGMLAETSADWLLWVDADAGFDADLAERLMEAADPVERPIVGALAFMVCKRESDAKGGWRWTLAPTIYNYQSDATGKKGFIPRYDYPENTLVRVGATGCHALLIHRSVLEKVRAGYGDTWFTRHVLPGNEDLGLMGEDFSFCVKAATAGFPVYVHTGVKTTHQQTVWIGEDDYQDSLWLSRLRDVAREEAAREALVGEHGPEDVTFCRCGKPTFVCGHKQAADA